MAKEHERLAAAYEGLCGLVLSLEEPETFLPTGARGFEVRDLVRHLLGDAQRALVALATPATPSGRGADRDFATYWSDAPGAEDADYRGLRAQRVIGSVYGLGPLQRDFTETARAVVTLAARTNPDDVVATQGHALSVRDLMTTLTVEAAVHHLDLVRELDRHGPAAGPLSAVRETLDAILGGPVPLPWTDEEYAVAGTGRRPLTAAEVQVLGDSAARFPLLS